jgi:6-phosphogluconolactonase
MTTILTSEIDESLVYVGTYTKAASKGIYAFRFQPATGQMTPLGLAAETVNPSFLVVHPNKRFLYAVNEIENGRISAFSINEKTGMLKLLNTSSSGGSNPCHIAIDSSGKWLMAANYSSGSVSVLPIDENGRLGKASAVIQHSGSGKDPYRQEGPHAHSVNLSPDNRYLLVPDLGLDKVMIYRLNVEKGTLEASDPASIKLVPGAGPRHLSFHPNGQFAYLINELNSTLAVFAFDADRGRLKEIEMISTLPVEFRGINITAEIAVHPNSGFVYGSNRGHDSIVAFAMRGDKGILEPVEYVSTQGKTPRHFAIDPAGLYLFAANQDSNTVVIFRIDPATGKLTPSGTILSVPMPVCVVFRDAY